jgi:ABC-type Fe3+ transport system permease subunit
VLTYFIYDQLQFAKNDGKAAVLAIALFGVTLLLTLFHFLFLERRVSYER